LDLLSRFLVDSSKMDRRSPKIRKLEIQQIGYLHGINHYIQEVLINY
jgi:hypothetical protein